MPFFATDVLTYCQITDFLFMGLQLFHFDMMGTLFHALFNQLNLSLFHVKLSGQVGVPN